MRKQIEVEYCDFPDCEMNELQEQLIEHTLGWDGEAFPVRFCEGHDTEASQTFDTWIAYQLQPEKVTERRQARAVSSNGKGKRKSKGMSAHATTMQNRKQRREVLEAAGYAPHPGRYLSAELDVLREANLLP